MTCCPTWSPRISRQRISFCFTVKRHTLLWCKFMFTKKFNDLGRIYMKENIKKISLKTSNRYTGVATGSSSMSGICCLVLWALSRGPESPGNFIFREFCLREHYHNVTFKFLYHAKSHYCFITWIDSMTAKGNSGSQVILSWIPAFITWHSELISHSKKIIFRSIPSN